MHLRRLLPPLRRPLLVPLVVVALVTGACSSVVDDTAVTVEGSDIETDAVEEELEAVTSDADYQAGIEQQFGVPAEGEGEGTWNTAFVARLLSLQTYYELLEQELDRRGVEVADADVDAIRDQAIEAVGGEEVFEGFPAAYQDTLLRRRAVLDAIQAAFSEDRSSADPEAFYEENLDQFETRCVAHLLVGINDGAQPTGERTTEQAAARAQELYDQLQAGADFTELASSEANDDTASAAQGGELGCLTPTASFDPTFLEATFEAEVGEVTEPVLTPFGYHLILVSSAETPPFEEVEDQVSQAMAAASGNLFNDFLIESTCEGDIDVASRYGSWDTSGCTDGPGSGIGMVSPPEGPLGTNEPVAPGAGG